MGNLCDAFVKRSLDTWNWLEKSDKTGITLSEESITDYNLIDIQVRNPDLVRTDKFSHREESKVGADWDWELWLGAPRQWLGLRVQAKRIDPTTLQYAELDKENEYGRQIDQLITRAHGTSQIPVYVFYNYWRTVPPQGLLAEYLTNMALMKCYEKERIGELTALFGCSVSVAYHVKNVLDNIHSKSLTDLFQYENYIPWSCIVCCRRQTSRGKPLPSRFFALAKRSFDIRSKPDNRRLLDIGSDQELIRAKPPAYVSQVFDRKKISDAEWKEMKLSRISIVYEAEE